MGPLGRGKNQANATLQEQDGSARAIEFTVRLAEQTPELAEAAALYRAVLPLLRQYRRTVAPLRMEQQSVRSKLEAGLPLLVGETLPFDPNTARTLFLNLCKAVESARVSEKSSPGDGAMRTGRSLDAFSLWKRAQDGDGRSLRAAAARQIRRAVEHRDLDLASVWEMLAGGDWRRLELTAVGLKLDAELLRALARYSLKPSFQLWAQELQAEANLAPGATHGPSANQSASHPQEGMGFDRWKRGYCPVCGSAPSLSELQGKEGARRLRCDLCGAGWRYPHLKCASCQNDNYKLMSYFSVEGEEDTYKLQACDVCQEYIKIIKTFEPIPVDWLPVQDLATLHLDLIAAEHGYTRMTPQLRSGP